MASLEGNRLIAPGVYEGDPAPAQVEILMSEVGLRLKGATLKPGQGVIQAGEGLTKDATSGQYVLATTAADVEGFNRYPVDTGSGADSPVVYANVVLGGRVHADLLYINKVAVADAAALATALGGRYIASRKELSF